MRMRRHYLVGEAFVLSIVLLIPTIVKHGWHVCLDLRDDEDPRVHDRPLPPALGPPQHPGQARHHQQQQGTVHLLWRCEARCLVRLFLAVHIWKAPVGTGPGRFGDIIYYRLSHNCTGPTAFSLRTVCLKDDGCNVSIVLSLYTMQDNRGVDTVKPTLASGLPCSSRSPVLVPLQGAASCSHCSLQADPVTSE